MADFWEKKRDKKRGSLLLWSSLGALLGLFFLAPPGLWDSLLFHSGYAEHFGLARYFNEKPQSPHSFAALPLRAGPSSLDLVSGGVQNLKKINWDNRLGQVTGVSGLINPNESRNRPATVFLKDNPFLGWSKGRPVEGDLLSWALKKFRAKRTP